METLTAPDRCVDMPSEGKASVRHWEAAVEEREQGDRRGLEKEEQVQDNKGDLRKISCSVSVAARLYSLSDYPRVPPSNVAAVRPPRTAALIDDLIWDLTWHTLRPVFWLDPQSELSSLLNTLNYSLLGRPTPLVVTWSFKSLTLCRAACGEQTKALHFLSGRVTGYKYCQMHGSIK